MFRNVERSPGAVPVESVLVVRVDALLLFANAEYVKAKLLRLAANQRGTLRRSGAEHRRLRGRLRPHGATGSGSGIRNAARAGFRGRMSQWGRRVPSGETVGADRVISSQRR